MFWKKATAERNVERSAGADEQALDTVARLLRSFGNGAFDTEDVLAEQARTECEAWAQRITVGPDKREGDATEFRRDYGGLLRYFSAHRSKESDFVGKTFTNLREAVQTFARCLTAAVAQDKSSDDRLNKQLGRLVQAFESNDPVSIRREAEKIAGAVQQAIEERKQRQAEQLVLLGEKIKKLRGELQRAREQAVLDPLTHLHNRAALDAHLERVSDLAFLLRSNPCLLMIDVDCFKAINDRYGHPTGDEVLKRIADALVRQFLCREDFVARYGGEEFAVVISDSTLENAKRRADRVREAVSKLEIPCAGGVVNVTISIGLASLAEGDDAKSWLSRADVALYEAKGGGRNAVRVATFPPHSFASLQPEPQQS